MSQDQLLLQAARGAMTDRLAGQGMGPGRVPFAKRDRQAVEEDEHKGNQADAERDHLAHHDPGVEPKPAAHSEGGPAADDKEVERR